jgi:hypothetical protein
MYSFKIDPEVADALKQIKKKDGVGESEQIRRGIDLWLKSKGVSVKTAPAARRTRRKA